MAGLSIRVGIVSSRDTDKHRVRCYFPGMDDLVSGWLFVLQRPGSSSISLPSVNDRVLVLYPDGWNMDGYVMGVIP